LRSPESQRERRHYMAEVPGMRSSGSNCLTRVVVDDGFDLEVGQLQSVMQRIQQSLRDIPASQREYIANALLNVAVTRMVKEEGSALTASILARLGDVVATGNDAPDPQRAVDLSRLDG
jgi:hypothetical protein